MIWVWTCLRHGVVRLEANVTFDQMEQQHCWLPDTRTAPESKCLEPLVRQALIVQVQVEGTIA